jgi:hypothetical protein
MLAPVSEARPHSTVILTAAAASVAAALVHAAAAGTHAGDPELVRLFAVCAAAQAIVAGALLLAPTKVTLGTVLGVNLAAVAAWAFSRTTGLPWPDSLKEVEEVGAQDLAAAVTGAVAALAAGAALFVPASLRAKAAPTALAGAVCTALIAIAVPGMAAEHHHGAGEHAHGGEAELATATGTGTDDHAAGHDASHDASHDDATITAAGGAPVPTGPVISLDDVRVTPAQRQAAQDLIDRTAEAMAAFPDQAAVEAAGYTSIGDSVTGFEHFINVGYIADADSLDPAKIESIVFVVNPDGSKEPASAMYILPFDKTMADVPDIAGELTTWHDHQNLCWQGARVVGTTDATGSCTQGVFRATPPMLHVWLPDHVPACGPFAGLEGHGGDCSHHSH